MVHPRTFAAPLFALALACSGTRVGFVDNGPRPPTPGDEDSRTQGVRLHHGDDTENNANPSEIFEPEHPAVQTREERALVHIHTPQTVCSGAVIGPKLILTAQRCLRGAKGPVPEGEREKYRVEVASSTLTWTERSITYLVVPDCEWEKLDMAILVLDRPMDWVEPLKFAVPPGPGAGASGYGFGKCPDEKTPPVKRTGEIVTNDGDEIIVNIPYCRGGNGGPLIGKASNQIIGVVSHREDPNRAAPRRNTASFRVDTKTGRALKEQAEQIAQTGALPGKQIACETDPAH